MADSGAAVSSTETAGGAAAGAAGAKDLLVATSNNAAAIFVHPNPNILKPSTFALNKNASLCVGCNNQVRHC